MSVLIGFDGQQNVAHTKVIKCFKYVKKLKRKIQTRLVTNFYMEDIMKIVFFIIYFFFSYTQLILFPYWPLKI